jgi:hypothetical protein
MNPQPHRPYPPELIAAAAMIPAMEAVLIVLWWVVSTFGIRAG